MPRKYPQLYDPVMLQKLQDECGSDLAIAEKVGCTIQNVAYARKITGIKRIEERGGSSKKFPMLYNLVEMQKLREKYGSDVAIARAIGCTPATVRNARYILGIPSLHSKRQYSVLRNRDEFLALRPDERTAADIATEIGCSTASVHTACKRFEVQRKWYGKVSPCLRHPDVLAFMMARYNSDILQIADIIGADPTTVRKAITQYRKQGYDI